MTSTRSVTPTFRFAAAAVVALATLPLSGCLFSAIPTQAPATDGPISTPDATAPETTAPGGDLPAALTFEAGAQLPETAFIQWADGLMTDDGWTVASPDDGNGSWTYGTIDGACTAEFYQGLASDAGFTPGDDRASSDAILAILLQADPAEIAQHAVDGSFGYQIGGSGDVAHRQLTGQQDGRTWIMAARAFTATDAGVYLIVDCTGADAATVFDEVVEKNAIIVD